MTADLLITALPDYIKAARALAAQLDAPFAPIDLHRFPDGETRVRIPDPDALPPQVVICQSLHRPDAKLIALLLAGETFREAGVARLSLVAPYLCYMRQDKAFHPGEAVSQRIIGRFLASLARDVISVDAHLHRVHSLAEAVPATSALNLSAAPTLGAWLAEQDLANPLILGPDRESRQWVEQVAAVGQHEFAVASKQRFGDREVRVTLPEADYQGRTVVLVDDVVSSGHTLAEAARGLRAAGAGTIHALVTHALFADGALELLAAAGIEQVWSSDSIPHPTNTVRLAPLLAAALAPLLEI